MKKILVIAMMALSFGIYAQEVQPTFEKEGNKVKATYFHANGEVAQQGYFLNEKLEGEWKMFNAEGDKIAVGNYSNGVRTGKWTFWEADVIKEVNFDNNRIAGVVEAKSKKPVVVNK